MASTKETLTFPHIGRRMDGSGIPKLQAAHPDGLPEPDELFFDARTWQWLGRTAVQINTRSNTTGRSQRSLQWICEQTPDGRWVRLREATAEDNQRIEAAKRGFRAAEVRDTMEAIR
jgi:hypothetical protein